MQNLAVLILMALTLAGLSACGAQPPKCSEEQTTSLVLQILAEQLSKMDGYELDKVRTQLALEFPVAKSMDEKVKRLNCEGQLVVAGKFRTLIGFASLLNDDNRHVVMLDSVSADRALPLRAALAAALKPTNQSESDAKASSLLAPADRSQPVIDVVGLVGKHPAEVLDSPTIKAKLQPILKDRYSSLSDRVDVASEVKQIGPFLFGSGCMPHSCGSEEGAYAVNIDTGEAYAAILSNNVVVTYGALPADLPAPLHQWYIDNGGKE